MATSYNGWRVLTTAPTRFTAGGRSWYAANRDVATVFAYLIGRFDREVESVDAGQLDDWSYAVRPVRGQSTGYSCHASATAIDINALRHPRGSHGTFSMKTKTAVRRILADINRDDQIVRWGEDFSATIDGMHFEIVAGERAVRQAAERIRALQEDDVTPEDRNQIAELAAKKVLAGLRDLLLTDRFIPNEKVTPDEQPHADMTFAGCLSNIELNQDQQTRSDGLRHAEIMTALAKLGAAPAKK
ncbi:M15 family metallopeptidase [Kineosporia sp. J2-2]|uniref:M15 family metallopeptidase n=1 Tax=Kineosporia corallincola TaxID=2835133 RepID=A0ABS5TL49_9ACTN|nr:M15 family metallopeptidase [Kineosporia corallincola]MBT0771830.1 M15 family metallopeptidase [Kineosporia corallincola]